VEKDIKLRPEDIEIEVNYTPEYTSPRESFDSGIPEYDKEDIAMVERRIDTGNPLAWCMIEVKVSWEGLSAFDLLGCCTFESEEEFLEDACYQEMLSVALHNLNQTVNDTHAAIHAI